MAVEVDTILPDVEATLRGRLGEAVRTLDLLEDRLVLLRHRKGAAAVLRVGGAVVKAFEESHREDFERELVALRALAPTGLVAEVVGSGDLWIATRWCDLVPPAQCGVEPATVDRWLGETLAKLHRVDPTGLPPLSLEPRLAHWLAAADDTVVGTSLRRSIQTAVLPLVPLLEEDCFVHGDWGDSNVLVRASNPTEIAKVVDLEDARRGDPAEDFKWQLVQGPPWLAYRNMAEAYRDPGGDIGPNGTERLVVAATDWALDVLTWYPAHRSPFASGAIATLNAFAIGIGPSRRRRRMATSACGTTGSGSVLDAPDCSLDGGAPTRRQVLRDSGDLLRLPGASFGCDPLGEVGVFDSKDLRGKQCGVLGAVDCHGRNREAWRHLHDGVQGVHSVEGRRR